MSRYVQTSSGDFVRHIRNEVENIRWDETNKTSVRKLTEAQRVEFGISPLKMVTPPSYDSHTQIREEGDAVLTDDVWTQNWIVTEAPEDIKGLNIRQTRGEKLEACDWHGLSDNVMSEEMTTYRQALRDIPEQDGFPNETVWPVEPS
tara:strand:+ start:817 stop:1257 length:441 start_codon:yes stop_codon:yes gene_type:complete